MFLQSIGSSTALAGSWHERRSEGYRCSRCCLGLGRSLELRQCRQRQQAWHGRLTFVCLSICSELSVSDMRSARAVPYVREMIAHPCRFRIVLNNARLGVELCQHCALSQAIDWGLRSRNGWRADYFSLAFFTSCSPSS
jgi:hypothetical protein